MFGDEFDPELPVEGMRKMYLNYLFSLYLIELEDGIDMGSYPSFNEFQQIVEEEKASFH